ncbi:Hint domain-containing protein [Rhodovulum adriaticum]|uniref:Hint domain-containing protein n=1 Tax=Rhodovulum adriaticum TaxID=35804 RepID=A0A4R2NYK9_RHOAD|nr:Hint domain-containing protein [Rhodovulum adriaticum]MBK1634908.1 hypothetical protein [Rhodovulum adriaticum]TCP27379.1 Hint domain-containing protein [Rhodovulum adriaticum]
MTWSIVTDPTRPDAGTWSPFPAAPAEGDSLLHRGSLSLEAELGRAHLHEGTLLLLHVPGARPRHLSIQITAGSHVVLAHRWGARRYQVTLDRGGGHLSGRIRLTLTWDLARGTGLLSLEECTHGVLVQKALPDPLPLLRADVERLCTGAAGICLHPGVDCLAVADTVQPVGLRPTLATGTPLLTPGGPVAVEALCPGDLVQTRDHGPVPVWRSVTRDLPAAGGAVAVQLLAPYLGLRRDILVTPDQGVMIGGAEVEYLFGVEEVLVDAQGLCPGPHALRRSGPGVLRVHQVLLERHEILEAAGCPVESLFIGQLRDVPDLLATTCLGMQPPETLPLHPAPARRRLVDYEMASLHTALLAR